MDHSWHKAGRSTMDNSSLKLPLLFCCRLRNQTYPPTQLSELCKPELAAGSRWTGISPSDGHAIDPAAKATQASIDSSHPLNALHVTAQEHQRSCACKQNQRPEPHQPETTGGRHQNPAAKRIRGRKHWPCQSQPDAASAHRAMPATPRAENPPENLPVTEQAGRHPDCACGRTQRPSPNGARGRMYWACPGIPPGSAVQARPRSRWRSCE